MKKYKVSEAIWLAAAFMAAEKYPEAETKEDMFFRQADIVRNAQLLTDEKIDPARVSQWTNADHNNSSCNYLRADSAENPSYRRLSMIDEFPQKTYPEGLDTEDRIEIGEHGYYIEELFCFVREQYPELITGESFRFGTDYRSVLKYLEKYRETPYSTPEQSGISKEEKARLTEIRTAGQSAVSELEKTADAAKAMFGLDKCIIGDWLDGSKTKTRNYLQIQLKYADRASDLSSISVFAEMRSGNEAIFRVSLDIKSDSADKAAMSHYHSHLDLPLNTKAGLVYMSGSNVWGRPEVINDTRDSIKEQLADLRKVQVCSIVEPTLDKTDAQYHREIMAAIRALLPYYNHVVGKQLPLEAYDPGIGKEQWKELLEDTAITTAENLRILKMLLELGGEASFADLAAIYGGSAERYQDQCADFGRRVHEKTGCPLYAGEKPDIMCAVPFICRNDGAGELWKLRTELKEALGEMDLSGADISNNESKTEEFDKNLILYGPPGTGKTYNTAIYAVAICEGKPLAEIQQLDYDEVMKRYDSLKKAERIAFTTFHQSYGYEEFIEGIKPIVDSDTASIGYTLEPGVFKRFCEKADRPIRRKGSLPNIKENPVVWKVSLEGAGDTPLKRDCFENGRIRIGWPALDKTITEESECGSSKVKSILTSFEYTMDIGDIAVVLRDKNSIDAIGVITGEYEWLDDGGEYPRSRRVQWLAKDINEDIRDINHGKILTLSTVYKLNAAAENVIKLAVKNNPSLGTVEEEKKPNCVFIIDEINRGNISKIFGELITLIEDSKRKGMREAASAILPYSGEEFSVPSNVYIIGTMNTADRSIAIMDTALRRRFRFIEMMPDADILRKIGAQYVGDLDVVQMLEKMNERIAFLYDREHTIGHAFFTKLAESPTLKTLQTIFEESVIPLLQEYFYEDYQKIQLVLGDNGKADSSTKFILDEKVEAKNIFKNGAGEAIDLPEKKYSINREAFSKLESYKQII